MGRSSQVWGKRFPYVSLPFCPLYLPPSQLSLLIPILVPSSPSSSPACPSSTQEPTMGGLSSISPRISLFSLSPSHRWLLAIGYPLWLWLARSTFSLFLHPLSHASLKREAGAGSVPPGVQLFFPHSISHLCSRLLSGAAIQTHYCSCIPSLTG